MAPSAPVPVMLITGAGRGIGAATAQRAAAAGFRVAVNYRRDQASAEAVVNRCLAEGVDAVAIRADVSVEADVLRLFGETGETLGPVTSLVNNAGVVAPKSRLDSFSVARMRELVDVNIIGSFLCAREAVRTMSTSHGGGGGTIVNVSSAASYAGSPHEYIDYAATKGAIDTMTIGLAKEVAEEGIRVNAVRPGLIHTEIHEPGRIERLAATVPMKRGGTVDEVAATIIWLAAETPSYVTGALINCAGGR